MLEDDAEPSTPTTIDQITSSIIPIVMEENQDVIFAKLFYSFGYQGFSTSFETFVETTSFFLFSSLLIYCALSCIGEMRYHKLENTLRRPFASDRIVIAMGASLLLFLFVLALGRQSTLLALKNNIVPYRISKAQPDQTTAILYPRTKLNEVTDLLEHSFVCASPTDGVSSKEEVAIDIQLANVIDKKYDKKKTMIWVHGDFFNHIGFYTSLHFKGLHVTSADFVSRYITLPDIYCNYPD